MLVYSKRQNCRLCRNKGLKLGFKLKPSPFGDSFFKSKEKALKGYKVPTSIYWCSNCKHVQSREYINPRLLWKNYTYLTSQSKMIIDHMDETAKKIIKRFKLNRSNLVVDIGSNDGTFLKFFRNKKIKTCWEFNVPSKIFCRDMIL